MIPYLSDIKLEELITSDIKNTDSTIENINDTIQDKDSESVIDFDFDDIKGGLQRDRFCNNVKVEYHKLHHN